MSTSVIASRSVFPVSGQKDLREHPSFAASPSSSTTPPLSNPTIYTPYLIPHVSSFISEPDSTGSHCRPIGRPDHAYPSPFQPSSFATPHPDNDYPTPYYVHPWTPADRPSLFGPGSVDHAPVNRGEPHLQGELRRQTGPDASGFLETVEAYFSKRQPHSEGTSWPGSPSFPLVDASFHQSCEAAPAPADFQPPSPVSETHPSSSTRNDSLPLPNLSLTSDLHERRKQSRDVSASSSRSGSVVSHRPSLETADDIYGAASLHYLTSPNTSDSPASFHVGTAASCSVMEGDLDMEHWSVLEAQSLWTINQALREEREALLALRERRAYRQHLVSVSPVTRPRDHSAPGSIWLDTSQRCMGHNDPQATKVSVLPIHVLQF
ncbi:hypothetical protein P7C70_g6421, partial [Phenoliferia sp. Uapishka_3]